jgi:hypothetical protein
MNFYFGYFQVALWHELIDAEDQSYELSLYIFVVCTKHRLAALKHTIRTMKTQHIRTFLRPSLQGPTFTE